MHITLQMLPLALSTRGNYEGIVDRVIREFRRLKVEECEECRTLGGTVRVPLRGRETGMKTIRRKLLIVAHRENSVRALRYDCLQCHWKGEGRTVASFGGTEDKEHAGG